mmetsp:Transcript_42725/g.41056  ORF Transcript_42725/g.41056 Transcript_42725/m.41056 type:complete len:86 (+) Transcript_42725:1036-1293(+)
MFAANGVGAALSFTTDMGKAQKKTENIFRCIEEPSKINAVDIPSGAISVPEKFIGEIEFKNVWFRYPSRKSQWVLKEFNLRIRPG